MDELKNILAKKSYDEPPEIKAIKDYARKNFEAAVSVTVYTKQIIITVPNAALAGTLRLNVYQIAQTCKTTKKIIIRIGSLS